MKLKQIPEDFQVDELYDLEIYKNKENESETGKLRFKYFELWKRDYTVQRALEHVCKVFKLQARDVHFAGTKDRVAVTTQLISMRRLRHNWEEDLEYFNNKNPDIKLKFIGEFPSRLNLGDNLGNKFKITVRDLENKDIEEMQKNIENIREHGVPNYFDSQRFGFSGKNPIIGKYFLRGDFKKAFFHVLTAAPEDIKEEHKIFVDYLTENYESILESNDWSKVLELLPEWLRLERRLIEWVAKWKNDFLGAMGLIHKKIRTMYVNSYQSYLFNETIKYLKSIGSLEKYKELPLVAFGSDLNNEWGLYVQQLLSKDGLNLEYFKMPRSPTLQPKEVLRNVHIPVNNLQVSEVEEDDLNEGKKKVTVTFELGSGSYATNAIKVLFNQL
jgi:tRNA pseudouridine13 synthase